MNCGSSRGTRATTGRRGGCGLGGSHKRGSPPRGVRGGGGRAGRGWGWARGGEDEVGGVARDEAEGGRGGGLRLGANDSEVLAHQGVEQGGLSDVGPASEDDGAAAGHHTKISAGGRRGDDS